MHHDLAASEQLTGVVIALDEADRIGRCVSSLKRVCARVLVIDSGSRDDTVAVALAAGAEVLHQDWLGFAAQKNHAIAQALTDWVLLLDADEWLSDSAVRAIQARFTPSMPTEVDAFDLPRQTIFLGRALRFGGWGREWLPRLFRARFRYRPDAVHERLNLDGAKRARIEARFLHTPVRDLDEHYRKLARYAALWAEGRAALGKSATFLDLYLHPAFYLLKNYLLRGGFLDGREGAVFHLAYAAYTHSKYARLWARRGVETTAARP